MPRKNNLINALETLQIERQKNIPRNEVMAATIAYMQRHPTLSRDIYGVDDTLCIIEPTLSKPARRWVNNASVPARNLFAREAIDAVKNSQLVI